MFCLEFVRDIMYVYDAHFIAFHSIDAAFLSIEKLTKEKHQHKKNQLYNYNINIIIVV